MAVHARKPRRGPSIIPGCKPDSASTPLPEDRCHRKVAPQLISPVDRKQSPGTEKLVRELHSHEEACSHRQSYLYSMESGGHGQALDDFPSTNALKLTGWPQTQSRTSGRHSSRSRRASPCLPGHSQSRSSRAWRTREGEYHRNRSTMAATAATSTAHRFTPMRTIGSRSRPSVATRTRTDKLRTPQRPLVYQILPGDS